MSRTCMNNILLLSWKDQKIKSTQSQIGLSEEIRCVTHVPPQPSQKPKMETGLSKKDLWRSLLSEGENPLETCRRPIKFLKMLHQQKYHRLGWKGTGRGRNERRLLDSQNSTGRKYADEPLGCKHVTPFRRKGQAVGL